MCGHAAHVCRHVAITPMAASMDTTILSPNAHKQIAFNALFAALFLLVVDEEPIRANDTSHNDVYIKDKQDEQN